MKDFITKIIGDKKEWRAMEARAKALPKDYQIVYREIQQYIWKSSGVSGIDIFNNLLDFFEEGAASGQPVLQITGDDVAAFCDEILRDEKREKSYIDRWRESLNHDIAKKIGKK